MRAQGQNILFCSPLLIGLIGHYLFAHFSYFLILIIIIYQYIVHTKESVL